LSHDYKPAVISDQRQADACPYVGLLVETDGLFKIIPGEKSAGD